MDPIDAIRSLSEPKTKYEIEIIVMSLVGTMKETYNKGFEDAYDKGRNDEKYKLPYTYPIYR